MKKEKDFSEIEKYKASKKDARVTLPPIPEKLKEPSPLPDSVEKIRVPARNRIFKPKPYPIKLNLKSHYPTAVRKIIDNFYRWTKYNIQEIREYLEDTELKLNPSTFEFLAAHPHFTRPSILQRIYCGYPQDIQKTKELYDKLGVEWKQPKASKWLKLLLNLWETSRKLRGLTNEYLTIKEWYEKMELEFPKILEPESDRIITNRKDLERTGIFEDIEHNITRELGIEDEIERLYNETDLTPFDINHAKTLIRENPDHPYAISLKEKLRFL